MINKNNELDKFSLLNEEKLNLLKKIIKNLSSLEISWISGYLWGISNSNTYNNIYNKKNILKINKITILSSSQTGNARGIAEVLHNKLIKIDIKSNLINAIDYKYKNIINENIIIIITSTYGNGGPPEETIPLYNYLHSELSINLSNVKFAVLSLGNISYKYFAKAGKDFDNKLKELGAKRIYKRIDLNVDYYKYIKKWYDKIICILKKEIFIKVKKKNNFKKKIEYNRCNPFTAKVLKIKKITSENALKDVRHIEFNLLGSNIRYIPGDALGLWPKNDPNLVNQLLKYLKLNYKDLIKFEDNTFTLWEFFYNKVEIIKNTPDFIKKYSVFCKNKFLDNLILNNEKLYNFSIKNSIIDVIKKFTPNKFQIKNITKLFSLLTPRLYSISSSQAKFNNEAHITVNIIYYKINNIIYTGNASGYLVNRLNIGNSIDIFIKENNNFRLPIDNNVDIIMICAGSGIAPFRSFIQQREYNQASGKNWLFFGNQNLNEDFLYKDEWLKYKKCGLLTNINLAWSRSKDKKVYVQDLINQNAAEIWLWINNGANLYICGNAANMARNVEQALINLISKYGSIDINSANKFLDKLRILKRYQKDIY